MSRASGGNLERRRFVLHTEFVLGSRISAKVIVMKKKDFCDDVFLDDPEEDLLMATLF